MVWRSTAAMITAPIKNATIYLNRWLSSSIPLASPGQKFQLFDSEAPLLSADAIAQLGQVAIMTAPVNLNLHRRFRSYFGNADKNKLDLHADSRAVWKR